ncbi:MAG: zf-HC2 domain-containing protein [Giesbergeria sp.]|jgi:anti-sigma factor RsiW|nr:zf-HC2 domain-containing protein [Giesbergeria sp.]
MTCPTNEALSAYADRMLAPRDRTRLERHLQGCRACQHRIDELVSLQNALRALPSPTLGFDLSARLEDRLRHRQPRRQPRHWLGGWSGWVPAGFAAGMALASGVWMGGLLIGGGAASTRPATMVRVFDPVPPGGLCAAAELCRLTKGMP